MSDLPKGREGREGVTCDREKVTVRTVIPLYRDLAWRRTLSLAIRPLVLGCKDTRTYLSHPPARGELVWGAPPNPREGAKAPLEPPEGLRKWRHSVY